MIERGPANENEMILAFLKAEADSQRFSPQVIDLCAQKGFCRSELIDAADLENEEQNTVRRSILAAYRGFNQNVYLFTNFTFDVTWRRVDLELKDHDRIMYANEPSWVKLSDGTRQVKRLVRKLQAGEIPSDTAAQIKSIEDVLATGKQLPELIAAQGANNFLILIEGHCRASAYVALKWKGNIPVILGSSASMQQWHWY